MLLITIVLLQVLTLVIFGHPMGREFLDNILESVLYSVVLKLFKIEMCLHRWGNRLTRRLLLGYFDADGSTSGPPGINAGGPTDVVDPESSDDSGSDSESDPGDDSTPPPPPSSGAAAVEVEKKATAPELVVRERRTNVRSRAHTPGRCARTRVLMYQV